MGRPLKTTKYNPGEDTWVDEGYPNNGSTNNGFSRSYPGVFGGVGNDYAIEAHVAVEESQPGKIYSTAGVAVIWSPNAVFHSSETVSVGSTIYAASTGTALGTVNTINAPVASITIDAATAGSTDSFTTKGGVDTSALVEGGPIVLSTDYAGLTGGTVYFVKTIVDSTHFTVSATQGGAKLDLSAETADITASQGHSITLDANATATVSNSAWTASTPDNGYILRQKGKKKFLVARNQTINDEFIAAGGSYYIASVSDTDWAALGAGPDAGVGKIFTAKIDGTGLTTDGTVYPVGVCTLTEAAQADLTRNQMSVVIDKASGTDTYASSVTDHFVVDFTDNGTDENMGTKYIASYDGKTDTPDAATQLKTVDLEYWC